jgi:HK97 family phage major capsid protein
MVSAATTDLYDQLLGDGGLFNFVESDGFMVNGSIASLGMKAKLRGLRDLNKQPIFMRAMNDGQNLQGATRFELDGSPIFFPQNGAIDPAAANLVAGDWSQVVYSIRQDMTFKILSEAVIQDDAGNIVFNLAQQDMVALRAVMRLGWQIPNPTNMVNANAATRLPFAALVP